MTIDETRKKNEEKVKNGFKNFSPQ